MYFPLRVVGFFLLTFLFISTSCVEAQKIGTESRSSIADRIKDLEPVLDKIVEEEMKSTHLPGVALVVVHDGKVIIKRGYGVAEVATSRPVDTERTLFRIGSVSKALTAFAVTRLIDQGKLRYDEDVSSYGGDMTNLSGSDEPVEVRHLLTHTGGFDQIGLDRHIYEWNRPLTERKAQRPDLDQFLSDNNLRRITPPGHVFRYDTYGITLAGLILSRITKLPFDKAMQQELFAPLGMLRSFVEAEDDYMEDVAIGYGWENNRYVSQPYEIYVTTPASSIDATPADMGRLLEALTGEGANEYGRLYSKETALSVLAPQYRPHPRFTGITHGLWESPSVNPPNGPAVHSVGHGGSMLGFWTLMEIFTEKNVGVFIATNRNWEAGGGPVHVGQRVTEALLNALYDPVPGTVTLSPIDLNGRDLSSYTGEYVRGIYCQSCTPEETLRGAWQRGNPLSVSTIEEGLRIDDQIYLPTKERDIFVRQDRKREVFFGRDKAGRISFFSTSFGPTAFERIGD